VIYLVPLLGLLLVGLSGRTGELAAGWLDGAATLWVIAVGLAHSLVFPAERGLQTALSRSPSDAAVFEAHEPPPPPDAEEVSRLARRAERGVALVEVCYVAAFVLMYVKPA
jgi:hypothetical protein